METFATTLADVLPGLHLFRDRTDAGLQLVAHLEAYRGQDVLVLAIPRGGVPVGAAVAASLGAELDIVVARKLGAPFEPELAIGAVTANGGRYLNDSLFEETGVTESYLERITAREQAEARRQEVQFRGTRAAPRIEDRVVIVADDGLATGATMRAALRSARNGHPARLIAAVPVGAPSTCAALRAEADEVVAVYAPEAFLAVGLHYGDFGPTPDQLVTQLLRSAWKSHRYSHSPPPAEAKEASCTCR